MGGARGKTGSWPPLLARVLALYGVSVCIRVWGLLSTWVASGWEKLSATAPSSQQSRTTWLPRGIPSLGHNLQELVGFIKGPVREMDTPTAEGRRQLPGKAPGASWWELCRLLGSHAPGNGEYDISRLCPQYGGPSNPAAKKSFSHPPSPHLRLLQPTEAPVPPLPGPPRHPLESGPPQKTAPMEALS